jgi:putative glutamine amidotransferase
MKNKMTDDKPVVLVVGGGCYDGVRRAGGTFKFAGATDKDASRLIDSGQVHALILTGGGDVDPALYHDEPRRTTQTPSHGRDYVDLACLRAAMKAEIPVLGICRGAQIINVGFGGTLHQHIPALKHSHEYHMGFDHRVNVVKGTLLKAAVRDRKPWVPSIHHQAVRKVAPGFRVSARSLDNLIEAIEMQTKTQWVLGVQFHPEIDTTRATQGIFDALVDEAARVASMPEPKRAAWSEPVKTKTPSYATASAAWKSHPATSGFQFHYGSRGECSAEKEQRNVELALMDSGLYVPTKSATQDVVAWRCFQCGISFDEQVDHCDHMFFLHGIDVLKDMPDEQILSMIEEGP